MTPLHNSSGNGTASSESLMYSTGEDSVTCRSRAFVGTSAFQRAKKSTSRERRSVRHVRFLRPRSMQPGL